jgi:hypothetical protein
MGLIASGATEQDSANWLDKYATNGNIDGLSASVKVNATAIANANFAFASFSTSVTASLGTLSAGVSTNSSAIATVDGKLAASYSVTLDVNHRANGFKLLSDGTLASAIWDVDFFALGSASSGGGTTFPFSIGIVGGVAKVALKGGLLADGAIGASNIIAGNVIVTGHLVADAATSLAYVQAGTQSPGGFTTTVIASLSFDVAVGPILIEASVQVDSAPQVAATQSFNISLLIDGVVVRTWNSFSQYIKIAGADNTVFHSLITFPFKTTAAIGTRTIALRVDSLPFTLTFTAPSISVFESRR